MTAPRPTSLDRPAEGPALSVIEPQALEEQATEPAAPVVVEDVRRPIRTDLREAWRERRLLLPLGVRLLAKLIAGTKLGRLWLVIRPFMASLGMALIFGGVLGVATPNGIPYLVFFATGMLCWRMFERVVFFATRSFDLYGKLARTIDVPLLLVPLGATSYPAVEVAMYAAILIGSLLFYLVRDGAMYLQFGPGLLVGLAGLGLALAMAVGISLWTSVLNGKARDTRLTIRYVLEFWLYLTPVIYPLSAVPAAYQRLATLNPMTAPVEMAKYGLIGAGTVEPRLVAYSVAFTLVMLVSGLWFFNREAVRSITAQEAGDDEEM